MNSKGHTLPSEPFQWEFDRVLQKLSQDCFSKLTGTDVAVIEHSVPQSLGHKASITIREKSDSFAIELSTCFDIHDDSALLVGGSEQPRTDDIVKEYLNWLAGAVRSYLNSKGIKSTQSPTSITSNSSPNKSSTPADLHESKWQLAGNEIFVDCNANVKSTEWKNLGIWSLSDLEASSDDDSFELLG